MDGIHTLHTYIYIYSAMYNIEVQVCREVEVR